MCTDQAVRLVFDSRPVIGLLTRRPDRQDIVLLCATYADTRILIEVRRWRLTSHLHAKVRTNHSSRACSTISLNPLLRQVSTIAPDNMDYMAIATRERDRIWDKMPSAILNITSQTRGSSTAASAASSSGDDAEVGVRFSDVEKKARSHMH